MNHLAKRAATAAVFFLLSVCCVAATDDSPFRGEAFGDSSSIQEMAPGWEEKPLSYDPAMEGKDLVVVLNQQFHDAMRPLVEDYASRKGLDIAIVRGTCGISAGMLADKRGDVGAFCCPPAKTDRLPGLRFHTVGLHPISILVNPENPIDDLTLEQVRGIFRGEIRRWSELGWKDLPVKAVVRLHCPNRPGHWRLLLDHSDLFGLETRTVGAIEDVFSIVANDSAAAGYEVLGAEDRREGAVKTVSIDGRSSDDFDALLSGEYPLYRVLHLTSWSPEHLRNPHAKDLIDFVIRETEKRGPREGIVPVSALRRAGWRFVGDELVGEPERDG